MANPDDGFRMRFWDVICEYDDYLKAAAAINVLLLVMVLLAAPFVSKGSASHVAVLINFALLGPLVAVTFFLVWRCSNREYERRF
jgi:hypothetical protein